MADPSRNITPGAIHKKARSPAYHLYRKALRTGILIRSEECGRCGVNPGRGKNGRFLIEGHHADYAKPLEVEWLCAKCHHKETVHGSLLKTHCPAGHPYSEENTYRGPQGDRVCLICRREKDRRRYLRSRQ